MIVLTLADRTAVPIALERQHLVSVVAAHPTETLIRLTDGRRLRVRESLVEVLARWQADRLPS